MIDVKAFETPIACFFLSLSLSRSSGKEMQQTVSLSPLHHMNREDITRHRIQYY